MLEEWKTEEYEETQSLTTARNLRLREGSRSQMPGVNRSLSGAAAWQEQATWSNPSSCQVWKKWEQIAVFFVSVDLGVFHCGNSVGTGCCTMWLEKSAPRCAAQESRVERSGPKSRWHANSPLYYSESWCTQTAAEFIHSANQSWPVVLFSGWFKLDSLRSRPGAKHLSEVIY